MILYFKKGQSSIGGVVPTSLPINVLNQEYFVLPKIEFAYDSLIYGYEVYSQLAGQLQFGVFKLIYIYQNFDY